MKSNNAAHKKADVAHGKVSRSIEQILRLDFTDRRVF